MLTPRFACSQTDATVVVDIHCPAVRASEAEIAVDGPLLTVHVAPYFLRLHFPGALVEDDESEAKYDPGPGTLTVTITKATPGEHFPDLDLLAKLLAPRPPPAAERGPLIEVLASEDSAQIGHDEDISVALEGLSLDREKQEILEAAANDWHLPQALPAEPAASLHLSAQHRYGFLDAHAGYFAGGSGAANDVDELDGAAESLAPAERRRRRLAREDAKWDEEHYAADFDDDEYIQELLAWVPPQLEEAPETFAYTEAEQLQMLRLPRKAYLPTPAQEASAYLAVLSVLFAAAYDARSTHGEPTAESAWTLCALVPAFGALDAPPYAPVPGAPAPPRAATAWPEQDPALLAPTLAASYRRALAYPLFRHWALADACRADAGALLRRGKRPVVRALLGAKALLDAHDAYYVYAKVWLDDLAAWAAAQASEERVCGLGAAVLGVRMEKRMVGWDLEEIEALVRGGPAQADGADSDDEDASAGRVTDSDDESEEEVERALGR